MLRRERVKNRQPPQHERSSPPPDCSSDFRPQEQKTASYIYVYDFGFLHTNVLELGVFAQKAAGYICAGRPHPEVVGATVLERKQRDLAGKPVPAGGGRSPRVRHVHDCPVLLHDELEVRVVGRGGGGEPAGVLAQLHLERRVVPVRGRSRRSHPV